MESAIGPVVGQWYRHPDADKGEMFQVVGIDVSDGTVEVQYFDGDIEELERDAWQMEGLQNCAAPEDWTGPYDGIRHDDLGYSDDSPSEDSGSVTQGMAGDTGGKEAADLDTDDAEEDDE